MRQPLIARLLLTLAILLSGALVAAAQAAPRASEVAQTVLPARIAVVHAAPFAVDTTVTVVANDLLLLDSDFDFGELISYISVPAGTYKIEVFVGSLTLAQAAAATPVINESVTLDAGKDYTVAAIGTASLAYPLDLLILDDTTVPPASASAKLRVVHAAPFAPAGPTGTGVDVVTDAGASIGITNLQYPNNTGFVTLQSGVEFNLKVVATGTSTTIIDLDPVTLGAGDIVTVFAVGGANGKAPGVLLLPFVERAPAQLRLVHAAPFASGNATVTVTLNGQLVTNSLSFGKISFYSTLPAGIYNVQVFAGTAATGAPVINTVLVLQDGQNYTVVAMGTNSATYPLKLRTLVDDTTPSASATARLRVLHAAPFAPTVVGTAIDVVSQAGVPLPGLTNLRYDDLVENYTVPSGVALDLKIVPTGQPSAPAIIDLPALTFNAGDAYTVIAVGGANGQLAGVLLLNDRALSVKLHLPLIRK